VKFLAQKEDLLKTLKVFNKIKSFPYNVLLEISAENNILKFTGGNGNFCHSTFIDAEVKSKGKIYVNPKILINIINPLPRKADIEFKDKKDSININCCNSKYNLLKISESVIENVFTHAPSEAKFKKLTAVNFGVFKERLSKALNFTKKGEKYDVSQLLGVLFYFNGNLNMTATNSYYLYTTELKNSKGKEFSTILDSDDLSAILPLDYSNFTDVVFFMSENSKIVKIVIDKNEFYFTPISGKYPDFQDFLDETINYKSKFDVETEPLLKSIELANQVESCTSIKITPKKIKVSTNGDKDADNFENIISCTSNSSGNVNFNANFMTKILKSVSVKELSMFFTKDVNKPIRIIPKDSNDEVFLLAPMNTDN